MMPTKSADIASEKIFNLLLEDVKRFGSVIPDDSEDVPASFLGKLFESEFTVQNLRDRIAVQRIQKLFHLLVTDFDSMSIEEQETFLVEFRKEEKNGLRITRTGTFDLTGKLGFQILSDLLDDIYSRAEPKEQVWQHLTNLFNQTRVGSGNYEPFEWLVSNSVAGYIEELEDAYYDLDDSLSSDNWHHESLIGAHNSFDMHILRHVMEFDVLYYFNFLAIADDTAVHQPGSHICNNASWVRTAKIREVKGSTLADQLAYLLEPYFRFSKIIDQVDENLYRFTKTGSLDTPSILTKIDVEKDLTFS